MTYKEKLLDPRWQKKRLEVLQRDEFACIWCGDTATTLHVHHVMYLGSNPWDTPDDLLETLCADCHAVNHLGLSELEKTLLFGLRCRDRGNTEMVKMINRLVTRMVNERKDGKETNRY